MPTIQSVIADRESQLQEYDSLERQIFENERNPSIVNDDGGVTCNWKMKP